MNGFLHILNITDILHYEFCVLLKMGGGGEENNDIIQKRGKAIISVDYMEERVSKLAEK